MGVGIGFAIAASLLAENQAKGVGVQRRVVCVQGDSAFGFSGMELETACRYCLSGYNHRYHLCPLHHHHNNSLCNFFSSFVIHYVLFGSKNIKYSLHLLLHLLFLSKL